MTILAVYYAFADTLLLSQCFYYRGFRFSDAPTKSLPVIEEEDEESPLIYRESPHTRPTDVQQRRKSSSSNHSRLSKHVDATHLSPATPLLDPTATATTPARPLSTMQTILLNATALALVIAAGVFGWWISRQYPSHHLHHHQSPNDERISFDTSGQIFGYLCAALYLGSRVPQLLLNYRRKSTEGVSMLFFLFACAGNLTYVLSIFAYEPSCAKTWSGDAERYQDWCAEGEYARAYWRYIAVNTSWLVGSAGTLILDLVIFGQFWVYRDLAPVS